ncbi:MAG: hypothetical protein ACE5JF_03145 [Anaerolineales bacterium]
MERYLVLTMLSFAASVSLTRLFLELTGYPQLGDAELHIAHVLWGGLLLFIAALLPLIYANRWVYDVSAILAGLGVGLFIDEVGKFITQSNDYFYPAAAPIIYAVFLLTVLLFMRVRTPISVDSRAELYRALEALGEVLDHDLEPKEFAELKVRLERIAANEERPAFAQLATQLLEFLDSDDLQVAPERMTLVERLGALFVTIETRWMSESRHRAAIIGGLAALGTIAIIQAAQLLVGDPARLVAELSDLIVVGRVGSSTGAALFSLQVVLEGVVGLLILAGAVLLLLGRQRRGTALAFVGLLLSLVVVNLLTFYFEQFSTIIAAIVQFVLLVGVIRYRQRFMT